MSLNRVDLGSLSFAQITRMRLDQWGREMCDLKSTPILTLSISHEEREGELHLFTCTEVDDAQLELFLAYALREIHMRRRAA
jgi:hypothetical protein